MLLSIILLIALLAVAFVAYAPRLWPGFLWISRTNERTTWNLASYHDPTSVTWSWLVNFALFKPGEARVWPILMLPPHGQQKVVLRIPFIGFLALAAQQKMSRHPPADTRGLRLVA